MKRLSWILLACGAACPVFAQEISLRHDLDGKALDTLATLPGPRAAILGSMLELGANERELHARVGRHAADVGADVLVAVGPFAADYARGAAAGGLTATTVAEPADAAAILAHALPTHGTVLASDAFFPFRDGVDAAAEAGVTAIIQPGGSVRDEEVINAANEHGIAMIFTAMRHFRH